MIKIKNKNMNKLYNCGFLTSKQNVVLMCHLVDIR